MSVGNDKGAAPAAPTPAVEPNRGGRSANGGIRPSVVTHEGVGCDGTSFDEFASFNHSSADVNTLSSTKSEQPPQKHMDALREAYDRLHGQGAQDVSSFIRDFEGTIVDDATCDHQLANYLASGAYGFFVGKFVGEEFGAVVVLLEDTVRADVEVEPGHGSSLRLPAHNLAERILFLAGQKSAPQTKESGRPATNGSQPPCATIEGVADGDDLIKDRTLRGHCGDLPPQTHTEGDNLPRYTTKRLHDEIAKAKDYARRETLEESAKLAEADDRSDLAKSTKHIPDWLYHGQRIAGRIRALATTEGQS